MRERVAREVRLGPRQDSCGVRARQGAVKATELKYEEGRPGGFDRSSAFPSSILGVSAIIARLTACCRRRLCPSKSTSPFMKGGNLASADHV
jgi:hypothetical protein